MVVPSFPIIPSPYWTNMGCYRLRSQSTQPKTVRSRHSQARGPTAAPWESPTYRRKLAAGDVGEQLRVVQYDVFCPVRAQA
jgi:hypothetical protein